MYEQDMNFQPRYKVNYIKELIQTLEKLDIKPYPGMKYKLENMVDEFFKQGKKARDEKRINQIMENIKVNLFEGQLDENGEYIPAKFELLTYPAYYKIMSLQPN